VNKYPVAVLAAVAALCCVAVAPASAKTVWLCKPGQKNDACSPSLSTTHVSPSGKKLRTERVKRVARPKVDCFYVYPTVSDDRAPQADLSIDPELRSIALYQAARYSRDCKVYAPVYRQITLQGLLNPQTVTPEMWESGYADVKNAWREYLKKYNKGRGVMIIGHSQGTFVLRRLIPDEIDRNRSVRKRVISAYMLGGTVLVPKRKDVGGDFKNIPACRSTGQIGCVVAYNTYGGPVPADSRFGKTSEEGMEVLCNNPANLRRGGAGKLDSLAPAEPFAPETTMGGLVNQVGFVAPKVSTAWIQANDAYRGRCVTENGANVLQTTPLDGAPTLRALPAENWGLHLGDANLPLENLAAMFKRQVAVYEREQDAE
jgi:hypothetical protein